ncbi:MAG: RNA polymerase sigma factor [Pseudomonadota bacterium]
MSGFKGLSLDNKLVRRAQTGEAAALAAIFDCFAPAVYTLARRLCQSDATADDLTQETFVVVMKSLPDFRFESALATWVRRIAVTRCLMHLRSAWEQRATALDNQGELPTEPALSRSVDVGIDLEQALERLSPTARTVVWLYDVEGYSHQEIADLMGKSLSFSKSTLSRAHKQLRVHLDTDSQPVGATKDANERTRCSL